MRETQEFPVASQIAEAYEFLAKQFDKRAPKIGLILGSGLGNFAESLENVSSIDYPEIPHFPDSRVPGHAGKLCLGTVGKNSVLVMCGRAHYYEGLTLQRLVLPVQVMAALGVKTLIITNAAGGINRNFRPGDLVLIQDHINMLGDSPLRGPNDDKLGKRFPDMSEAYNRELRDHASACAEKIGLKLRWGVYAIMSGPNYETPAEIQMLARLGADLVGMSTVPEVIAANHLGLRVLGISCVTNLAAGMARHKLSHEEVTETTARVEKDFSRLLSEVIATLP